MTPDIDGPATPSPGNSPDPTQPECRPAPSETPPSGPDIDVPSPSQPGTEPPATPISPVA